MKLTREDFFKLGLAGEFVMIVEEHTEADPIAILFQFLVAFGNCCGGNAHFKIEMSKHHLNLFTVLVGASARARKGTSWDWVRKAFEEAEEGWLRERVKSGLSSGEGLIWAIRDPLNTPESTDAGIQDKRLLVVESEFASVLKQTAREGNILSPILRDAWDGKALQTLTKNQHAKCENPHISIIGHITNQELGRYLSATETFNGFGNRFAWIAVSRTKVQAFSEPISTRGWTAIIYKLIAAVHFAKSAGEIKLNADSKVLWSKMYQEIESKVFPGNLDHLLARASPLVLRFSAILALMDHSPWIETKHLEGAKILWDYCENSATEIFQGGGDLIKRIFNLVSSSGVITLTDLNSGLGRNFPKDRVDECLSLLMEMQKIVIRREKGPNGRTVTLISDFLKSTKLTNSHVGQ